MSTESESRRYGSDFGEMVGRLKRAAIDAYMASQGFWQDGGCYKKEKRGNPQTQQEVKVWVEMPSSLGAGGGKPDDRTIPGYREDYSVEFGQVRNRINSMLWRWQDLPDPDNIETVALAYDGIAHLLRMDDLEAEVAGCIQTVEDIFANGGFKGSAMALFQGRFINHLKGVVQHHWALSGIMANLMYSQVGIWTAARSGFIQVVEAATAGFNKVAQVPALGVEAVLRVLQYALSFADVDSLRGTIDKALEFGLEALGRGGQAGSEPLSADPGSFEEGMDMLQAWLDALAFQIWMAENDVQSVAGSNMGTVEAFRSLYELSGWSMDSTALANETAESVGLDDRTEVEGIDTALTLVYNEINDRVGGPSGAAAQDLDIAATVRRDVHLGLGQDGPADAVRELNEMLVDLMRNLAGGLDEGKRLLWAAYDFLNGTEAEAAARLDAIARTIDPGGAHDPWDYTVSYGARVVPNLFEAMGAPLPFMDGESGCVAPPNPGVDRLAERYPPKAEEDDK